MHTGGDPLPQDVIDRVEAMQYSIGIESVLDIGADRLAESSD